MSGYVLGEDRYQTQVFPELLEEYIAEENACRFIDAFVDGLDLCSLGFELSVPGESGRPGYHPRDMLKLYIYGYLNGIRSSRKLERECHRNVEVMWLVRKLRPDHKTISEFRRKHTKALRRVCREFTLFCKRLDLFAAELVAIDGSKFRAVNGKKNNYTRADLKELLKKIEEKITAYLAQMDACDQAEAGQEGPTARELKEKIASLKERKKKHEKLLTGLPEGDTQVSLTDPESRRMKVGTGTAVCYNGQIAVDSKHHLIVAHAVTNEENDLHQLAAMAQEAKEVLGVETLEVVADTGYHDEDELAKCEEAQIITYVPRPKSRNGRSEGVFGKSDFTYLPESDAYRCPAGQVLAFQHYGMKEGKKYRYYRTSACETCPLREQCTTDPRGRRIARGMKEEAVDRAAERLKAKPGMMRVRRCLAEHPFGSMKHWSGQGFFLLKGLLKVNAEFSLTVLGYNLRRVLNLLGVPRLLETLRSGKPPLSRPRVGSLGEIRFSTPVLRAA